MIAQLSPRRAIASEKEGNLTTVGLDGQCEALAGQMLLVGSGGMGPVGRETKWCKRKCDLGVDLGSTLWEGGGLGRGLWGERLRGAG